MSLRTSHGSALCCRASSCSVVVYSPSTVISTGQIRCVILCVLVPLTVGSFIPFSVCLCNIIFSYMATNLT